MHTPDPTTQAKPSLHRSPSSTDYEKPAIASPKAAEETKVYPPMPRIIITITAVYMTNFLVALVRFHTLHPFVVFQTDNPQDKTIIATAIPRITDDFNTLSDLGWYASAYLLTLCAGQLLWGKIYTFYPTKPTYLTAILLFEVGSAICGAAPSSGVFILGRAIAGLGSAGINNGGIMVVIETVPLAKRPIFQGLIGAIFGIAAVLGPLLGGVFTEHVSWRWCFYINLPFGAVALAIIVVVLHVPAKQSARLPFREQLRQMDLLGNILFLISVVCLLVALQWGGTKYEWSSWRIILLLVLFPVLFMAFLGVQLWKPETATLPMRVIKQRSIAAGMISSFAVQGGMQTMTYFIPLFFQAIKGFSPVKSGQAMLPFVLGLVVAAISGGAIVQKMGYPAPLMIVSSVLGSIGAGLLTTWGVDVHRSVWIGYQVLFGFGIGIGMQQPIMSAQIVLSDKDAPMGVALMFASQNLGGAIFVSVAQSVFAVTLAAQLTKIPGLNLSSKDVAEKGATNIKAMVPKELMGVLLEGYRIAIRNAFYIGLSLACASIVGAALMEWRSVKEREKKGGTDEEAGAAEGEEKASS
jgi:MFS family permease